MRRLVALTKESPALMQRVIRRLLLAGFIALYGAVSLCGSAIHSVPGFDHVAAGEGADSHDAHPLTSPHDDCPVCHFLAQGQLTTEAVPTIFSDRMGMESPGERPLIPPRRSHRPAAPRAPPLV